MKKSEFDETLERAQTMDIGAHIGEYLLSKMIIRRGKVPTMEFFEKTARGAADAAASHLDMPVEDFETSLMDRVDEIERNNEGIY